MKRSLSSTPVSSLESDKYILMSGSAILTEFVITFIQLILLHYCLLCYVTSLMRLYQQTLT